jgi:L-arabonate dehydrase
MPSWHADTPHGRRRPPRPERRWYKLFVDHVQQAHLGADLDFLVGASGAPVPRDSH